ncbi:MAG: carbamoyltransferase, partial [Deltaproteobacteria bacterium]|nr:carbamoyltransferase [Deltaproteobacteria bacterium]
VALNSVYNGKILSETPFKQIWIQPNASDGGTGLGAAAYVRHTIQRHPRTYRMTHAYLGPEYSDAEIAAFLAMHGIRHHTFRDDMDLVAAVADLLAKNAVIGWFQGRMEWGPRALGARSILANPCHTAMQAILNQKVKHREPFRPFAPIVCAEDAPRYFVCDEPVPEPTDYMLMVYPIREGFRAQLPAVTHVDGSGRVQTVRQPQNPRLYALLQAFGRRSGIPILVNTSFNIRGEPIVCSPYDAYKCMMGTEIDGLVMGRYFIRRDDNPQHMWDSERYATD